HNQRFAVSYITGSHAVKTGLTLLESSNSARQYVNDIPGLGPVSYTFQGSAVGIARPVSLTQFVSPNFVKYKTLPMMGVYAQDQWTRGRATLNYGVRFEYLREYAPAIDVPAVPAF